MIVISKKNTKKLIKGEKYTVENLCNSASSSNLWNKESVTLKEVKGRFNVKNFTDINGNPLPNIDINPRFWTPTPNYLEFEELKVGDLLICTTNRYKSFIKNGMYKIEKLLESDYTFNTYGTRKTRKIFKIKFEGHKLVEFNNHIFRKLNTDEIREISLSKIIEDKDPEIIKNKARKINYSKNKPKDLLINILQSLSDENRHSISIIDWAVKINKIDIVKDDFNDILNMNLIDILNMIESNE